MPKKKKCQFKSGLAPGYRCTESSLEGSKFCIFHKPNKTKEEAELFTDKLKKKLQNKNYDFTGYHFPKWVDFKNHVFRKTAWFTQSTFEQGANFAGSTFGGDVIFGDSTFEGDADFTDSIFEGHAMFLGPTFEKLANFWGSIFEGDADFTDSIFEGYANFARSTFEKCAVFLKTTFDGCTDFTASTFKRGACFEGVALTDNASAEQVFRIAKNCHQRQGEYTLAGEYYYKEKIAKRKQLPWYSPTRWFEYILLDGLCGYGERPLRAIRTGLGALLGLAFLYWKVGHIYPSPELFNQPHTLTFSDALYFSVVTFTTLGFGDWRPDPSHWIRYVVMSEAFIGAFLIALFIVTFARRMMR